MKILVIDDDPSMTDLLRMVLTAKNENVITANSGALGISLLKENKPDIVLLDLMMPEMDGWQVTTAIRKFSSVPILILSVLDNPGLVAKALDAGADDYLIKPVPSGVLIAHINNLTKRLPAMKDDASPRHANIRSAA
jgi:two-component system, OmpR family, KDP operon response regulator KdpE